MKLSRKNLRNMIIEQISLLKEGAEQYGEPKAKGGKLKISDVTYQLYGKVGFLPSLKVSLSNIKILDNAATVIATAAGKTKSVSMPINVVSDIYKAAKGGRGFKIKTTFTDTETNEEVVATLIGTKIS